MEKAVNSILNFSSKNWTDAQYDSQITSMIQDLNKIGANHLVNTSENVDLFEFFHPTQHSIGYLYTLLANIQQYSLNYKGLWECTTHFLESYDPRQISYVSAQFNNLVQEILHSTAGQPLLAVRPLKKAILRSSNPSRFSFLHVRFVHRCLQARCYRDATSVIDIDITEFPPSKKGGGETTYQDVLQYFLYSGMIYIGLKNWRRALEMLSYAVAYPGYACSAIQLEAYKKFLLVELILETKRIEMPPGTTAAASRAYKALTKPYEAFVVAFKTNDPDLLKQQAQVCMPSFKADGNAGLATQCMEGFRKFQISALTHTYVTLSVEEISKRDLELLGRGGDLFETEEYILGMVERDEIRASLFHQSAEPSNTGCVIHFHNKPYSEQRNLRALEKQIMRTITITNQAKALEQKLALSKENLQYLNKLSRSASGAGGSGGGIGLYNEHDPMDMEAGSFDSFLGGNPSRYSFDDYGDEDMMHHDSFDDEP